MKLLLKLLLALLSLLALVLGGAIAFLFLGFPKVGPARELKIESTPELVERGKYLAHHVAVCIDCHSYRDWSHFAGPIVPGSEGQGGEFFPLGDLGYLRAANITPTALGSSTDGELFRTITTGVKASGEPMFPLMPYLRYRSADPEDIQAIIAYIRTLASNPNQVDPSQLNFPMNLIVRTIPREAEPGKRPAPTDTIAYGKYLTSLAACEDCHTPMDKGTPLPGMAFAGGMEFELPPPLGGTARSANITPDPETGIGGLDKAAFIQRFKAYAQTEPISVENGQPNTVMPWFMYAGMTEEDLGAIYDYLRTVKPVKHKVERFSPGSRKS